jgi:hypothetical protein
MIEIYLQIISRIATNFFYHENDRQVTDFYGSGAIPVLRIRLVFS